VLGGTVEGQAGSGAMTASVEIRGYDVDDTTHACKDLPPLSCGPVLDHVAIADDESASDQGQVFLSEDGQGMMMVECHWRCTGSTWRLGFARRKFRFPVLLVSECVRLRA
jgi:hypothetical protein